MYIFQVPVDLHWNQRQEIYAKDVIHQTWVRVGPNKNVQKRLILLHDFFLELGISFLSELGEGHLYEGNSNSANAQPSDDWSGRSTNDIFLCNCVTEMHNMSCNWNKTKVKNWDKNLKPAWKVSYTRERKMQLPIVNNNQKWWVRHTKEI